MIDYNLNIGGVDLKDQFLHMYMVEEVNEQVVPQTLQKAAKFCSS
jgi:hypothetical protein